MGNLCVCLDYLTNVCSNGAEELLKMSWGKMKHAFNSNICDLITQSCIYIELQYVIALHLAIQHFKCCLLYYNYYQGLAKAVADIRHYHGI